MQRIRKTNTKPEMIVRRLIHALGYRYRVHQSNLPGTPDIVSPLRECAKPGHPPCACTARVTCSSSGSRVDVPRAKRTSGASATNSAVTARILLDGELQRWRHMAKSQS